MKTILIFTREYAHPKLSAAGGTGSFYKKYVTALLERGYKVIVFGDNNVDLNERQDNLHLHFTKKNREKGSVSERFCAVVVTPLVMIVPLLPKVSSYIL